MCVGVVERQGCRVGIVARPAALPVCAPNSPTYLGVQHEHMHTAHAHTLQTHTHTWMYDMNTAYSLAPSAATRWTISAAARGIIPIASGWMEDSVNVLPAPVWPAQRAAGV